MKNKFLQNRNDVIGNIILSVVLLIVILLPWVLGANTIISMAVAIVLGSILLLGFMQGLRNQEFDVITFSKEGVTTNQKVISLREKQTTRRLFTKAFIKWEYVSSVKQGYMMQPAATRGEKKVPKLIIHAKDEDDGSAIKLYMDSKEEILESIKYYKGLNTNDTSN